MGQYGFVRHRTADILNVIEDEVVALEFLHEVVWNSEGWYKLMTCDPEAPSLLSELFGSKTPTDEEIARALDTDTVQKCYSSYHNALALYHTVCLSGPTKNPITRDCACCIATVVCDLTVIIPTTVHSERANARLVMQLHRAQWAELVGVVKGLMRSAGLRCRRWAAPEYMCNLTNDIVTIGILYWMAKHRADSLEEFCRAREIALVEIDGDAEEQ
ncbi:hypothetical protein ID866_8388 [Astraeus odoratus]|nr:hypothetical protein ID866_8388 [Astraeus odoratus]